MKLYPNMTRENTVLLVIDPINSCASEKCETVEWNIHFSKIRDMMPKLKDFIDSYRSVVGGKIVFTTTTPWKKEYLTENINELYTDPKTYYYSDGTSGFEEQFYLVEPQKEDLVIAKNHYDAFTSPDLMGFLSKHAIRYIVVTGIFGDGCVLSSICAGFSKGYNFVILEDLIETTDSKIRQQIQKGLKEYTWPIQYGLTMPGKQFLSNWADKYPIARN